MSRHEDVRPRAAIVGTGFTASCTPGFARIGVPVLGVVRVVSCTRPRAARALGSAALLGYGDCWTTTALT
jgi:hypothetical protein